MHTLDRRFNYFFSLFFTEKSTISTAKTFRSVFSVSTTGMFSCRFIAGMCEIRSNGGCHQPFRAFINLLIDFNLFAVGFVLARLCVVDVSSTRPFPSKRCLLKIQTNRHNILNSFPIRDSGTSRAFPATIKMRLNYISSRWFSFFLLRCTLFIFVLSISSTMLFVSATLENRYENTSNYVYRRQWFISMWFHGKSLVSKSVRKPYFTWEIRTFIVCVCVFSISFSQKIVCDPHPYTRTRTSTHNNNIMRIVVAVELFSGKSTSSFYAFYLFDRLWNPMWHLINMYVNVLSLWILFFLSSERRRKRRRKTDREREQERLLWHASNGNNFVYFSFFFLLCHRFLIDAAIIGTSLARASTKYIKCVLCEF